VFRYSSTSVGGGKSLITSISPRVVIDTVKAHRKRLRRHFRREINGHDDIIFVMFVFVSCGLAPIGIEPFTDRRHGSRELAAEQPDRHAAHYRTRRVL